MVDTWSLCLWGFLLVCHRWLILNRSLPSCCMASSFGLIRSSRLCGRRQWPALSSNTGSICRRGSNGRYCTSAPYSLVCHYSIVIVLWHIVFELQRPCDRVLTGWVCLVWVTSCYWLCVWYRGIAWNSVYAVFKSWRLREWDISVAVLWFLLCLYRIVCWSGWRQAVCSLSMPVNAPPFVYLKSLRTSCLMLNSSVLLSLSLFSHHSSSWYAKFPFIHCFDHVLNFLLSAFPYCLLFMSWFNWFILLLCFRHDFFHRLYLSLQSWSGSLLASSCATVSPDAPT